MKKRIIWSNINLNIEDWRDGYVEWLEINNMEIPEEISDDNIYEWMQEENNNYLDDERMNLNKIVDGRILVIADIGRWDGRKQGYRIIESRNIRDILYDNNCDYCEWYSDGHNIKFMGHHHDGTNHYEYRVIREDRNIDNLLNMIYCGETISRDKLNYYTKSLCPMVSKIYGWR